MTISKQKETLVAKLAACKRLLSQPEPSFEPGAHRRIQAEYADAARKLVALEIECFEAKLRR